MEIRDDEFIRLAEQAECDRLSPYIHALLPVLEKFNRFDGPDLAGTGARELAQLAR
jgi:hypothetical protein